MNTKPIILIAGEPNSIFFEIFFKSLKYKKFKSPLILIASQELLITHMERFNLKKKIELLDLKNLNKKKLNNNTINIININYKNKNFLKKKSLETKNYINDSFNMAFKILKTGITNKIINGPINKSKFLNKKFLGVTEYIANKFNIKKNAMLIFNKKLSVCPLTTHLPLKQVSKKISKKLIMEKITLINNFYKINFGIIPKIAVTGINPHCESILRHNEDIKIVMPAVKYAKKLGYKVFGPFSADTIFQKNNREKYDVILGMYHDQVLTPIKTLYEFDAINITLGLPFLELHLIMGQMK